MGNCGCRYSLPVVTADSHGQEIRKAASSSSSGEVSWKKSQRGGEKSLRKLISCAKLRPVQQATATSTATAPATAQATAATRSAGPRATVAASPCRDTAAPPSAPASEDPPTHGGSNDLHLNVNDKNSVRDLGRQDITPPLTGMSTAAPKDKNRNGSSGDPGDIDDSINSKDDEFVGLSLPSELLQSVILPFLDSGCLGQAGLTCSQWRESALNERLWKTLCLKEWVGKHVALLEGADDVRQPAVEPGLSGEFLSDAREPSPPASPLSGRPPSVSSSAAEDTAEPESLRENKQLLRRADELEGGLEEVVAAMPIRALKRRLEDLGANPRRLEACLEKAECVSLVMGSMLLSREGLLREGGQLPSWVSRLRGWRWSYFFASADARRSWMTMDDLVRTDWTMSFPSEMPFPAAQLLLPSVPCKFHRDSVYTDEGFHQDGLDWHFEDSHRCVKVAHYPALEAERDASWGWRLVNPHVVFEQQH